MFTRSLKSSVGLADWLGKYSFQPRQGAGNENRRYRDSPWPHASFFSQKRKSVRDVLELPQQGNSFHWCQVSQVQTSPLFLCRVDLVQQYLRWSEQWQWWTVVPLATCWAGGRRCVCSHHNQWHWGGSKGWWGYENIVLCEKGFMVFPAWLKLTVENTKNIFFFFFPPSYRINPVETIWI